MCVRVFRKRRKKEKKHYFWCVGLRNEAKMSAPGESGRDRMGDDVIAVRGFTEAGSHGGKGKHQSQGWGVSHWKVRSVKFLTFSDSKGRMGLGKNWRLPQSTWPVTMNLHTPSSLLTPQQVAYIRLFFRYWTQEHVFSAHKVTGTGRWGWGPKKCVGTRLLGTSQLPQSFSSLTASNMPPSSAVQPHLTGPETPSPQVSWLQYWVSLQMTTQSFFLHM